MRTDAILHFAFLCIVGLLGLVRIAYVRAIHRTGRRIAPHRSPAVKEICQSSGPYRFSRQPVYFGVVLELVSLKIVSMNWVIASMALFWTAHITFRVLPREERLRRTTIAGGYDSFCAVTPRLLPQLPR